ncbi:hypothetical protein F373_gp046 [Bacillus phage SP-10]|uniref:hypothetical protein n=1 Tax=Bacillus phage SP10 TaxID=941058 RepID=UPI0002198B02|nr:hypothetical protein F373_gp046 [Bacillus phage SP-10]BAK52858.1 hypothetical protein [Bacillus phage SP-10]
MKSPRTRAILKVQGYIKRSSGFYEKIGTCDVCKGEGSGKDSTGTWSCLTCGGTGVVVKLASVEISRYLYNAKKTGKY